ncbi:MAG: arginine--tRNA ligase [Thermoleophilia bacterium]|nr:arginine--tRNA ligase [Thermoleophilia bacterium]
MAEKILIERPAARGHGDLATNLAMIAAGAVRRPPRELAAELADDARQATELAGHIETVEIAGPGFINFTLSNKSLLGAAREALAAGEGFGAGTAPKPEKILLEFVSANPTGQLHAGHARYAAYGDSLRRILSFAGHDVTTEFYINDYGSQMDLFGRSLASRYAQELGRDVPFPDKGYLGDYPVHLAMRIIAEAGDRYLEEADPELAPGAGDFFKLIGRDLVLEEMRRVLEEFRVTFDNWFSERTLHESGAVKQSLAELEKAGEMYEKDGALWLSTTRYGDDKDRVLVKENGELTYIAADIAYHRDKLSRGFDRLINIWGADHHGYVPRMKAALEALSHDSEKLEVIIGQLVNIVEMGERKQMSKRAGTMVTLSELIDSIGVDAARFFLVDRSHDSPMDLDIDKARMQSEENPVYYVQYAHARISSILRKAREAGAGADRPLDAGPRPELAVQERDLILKILEFPGAAASAAMTRGPQRLTAYARDLAAIFHVFYHNCPVIKAESATAASRLALCRLTRNVIARCLGLVGVSAPEAMQRAGD